jgi:hypothetical protein
MQNADVLDVRCSPGTVNLALYGIGKLAAMALTKWTEFAVMFSYLGGIAGFAATFFTQRLETSIERTGERHIKRTVRRLMKEGDDGH